MLYFIKYRLYLIVLLFSIINIISCTGPQKVVYLYNLKDSTANSKTPGLKDTSFAKMHIARSDFDNLIQKSDQLWITIGGTNLNDLIVVNSAIGLPAGAAGSANLVPGNSAIGYLVEADGNIKLPYLGLVKAEGLTRMQLESFLTEKFKDYTKNPVVNVRFLNYYFSVLGEVAKPGRFNMSTERTTILEALSMAGDLSDLGKRENVLVIREVNGQRDFARVNLISKDLFNSPYYYLKTNDVIYVEPVKTRFITRTGIPLYISGVAVGISLLITIINLIKK